MINLYKIRYPLGKVKKAIVELTYFAAYKLGLAHLANDSLNRLQSYKNKFVGRRCFIVGNAPSLNKMDLSKLRGEYCFVFNGAFEIANIIGAKTCFHAVEDRLVFEDHQNRLNNLPHPIFVPSDLMHLVNSNQPIICPFSRAWPEFLMNWPPIFNSDSSKPIFYWGGTVAIFGLELALWMGFKEIYIIGVDLEYKIPDSVIKKGNVLTSTEDDPNHYNKNYFGRGYRWHIPHPERMLRAFTKYSKSGVDQREIINSGVGGNLNCFTRKPFSDLFV